MAEERASAGLRAIDDPAMAPDKRIHEMRKNVKKLRALLRLVRPVFDAYGAENAVLRQAGRAVSGLRDRAVIAATVDDLVAAAGLDPADADGARKLVPARQRPGDDHAPDRMIAEYRAILDGVRDRARGWQIEGSGFDAFRPGLERTWQRARSAARTARSDRAHEQIHEWRKRVKDHWYHATILAPLWPEMMSPHVAAADALGEMLGRCGDLAITIAHLSAAPFAPLAGRLIDLAETERVALLAKAHVLHDRLFAERADALADRWEAWWKVWRSGN